MQLNSQRLIEMCDDVKKICLPLFLYLTIRYFRIVRSYADGTKIILCSNKFWLKQYFDEQFYNTEFATFQKMPDNIEGISIHGSCNSLNPVCQFWNKLGPYCEYNNILAMYKKNDAYLDMFDFGLSQDSHVAHNIFLNNERIFRHFINYFYQEAKPLMKEAYKYRFEVKLDSDIPQKTNWMLGLVDDYEDAVIEKMPLKEIYLSDNMTSEPLSIMEAKVILKLAKGIDKKEIMGKHDLTKNELGDVIQSITEKLEIKSEKEIKKEIFKRKLLPKLMLI